MKRCVSFILILLVFLSLNLYPVSKKQKNQSEEKLFHETIEVIGNIPLTESIQSISLIKAEDFKKLCLFNLKSALNLSPGIINLSTGKFGQTSSTFLRGSKSSQILWIVDGIKFRNNANLSGANLAFLSTDMIDKVEIVRGPMSSVYGSDAMGGVINIDTLSQNGGYVTASFGSHSSYKTSLDYSKKIDNFNIGVSVNNQRCSDGIENDKFNNTGFSFKTNYSNNSFTAGVRVFGNITDSGIPLNYGAKTPERNYSQKYYILAFPVQININKKSELKLKLAYTNSKYEFEDIEDIWNPYFMNKFNNYEAEIQYKTQIKNNLDLDIGLDYSNQNIYTENDYGPVINNENMSYFSAFLSSNYKFNNLFVSASFRYDKYKDVNSNISPQIGIAYSLFYGLKIRGSYSKGFKAPMLIQQINPWGASNFKLDPEKSDSYEIGLDYYSSFISSGITYFDSTYFDLIDWKTIDFTSYLGQYQNLDKVRANGVEIFTNIKPFSELSLKTSYTYMKTKDCDTNEKLLRRPEHTLSFAAAYENEFFTISSNIIYVGERRDIDYQNFGSIRDLPSYNVFDFKLIIPVIKNFEIFTIITNTFDREYEEILGYPAPGRRFEAGLKYKLN